MKCHHGNISNAPFSLDQIQQFFGFNPQTILPSQFGRPAPVQQHHVVQPVQQQIPHLIQQAIQLAGLNDHQLSYITKPECIQAMQGPHPIFTMENLTPLNGDKLYHITKPECIAAIGKINELFNVATSEYTYREDQKVAQYLNQGIFGVARVIYQLHDEIKNLKERNENTAAEAMSTVQQNLVGYLKEYLTSSPDDPNALNRFYKSSRAITNLPQFDILKQHRGWNHFFANLLLAFSTLGLSVVYCAWQTRGEQFFFKNLYNTESTESLEEITQKIGDVSSRTY